MKKIIVAIVTVFTFVMMPLTPVAAVNVFQDCSGDAANSSICKAAGTDKLFGAGSLWNRILNVFTMVIGAVAVLMMIIGGLRYVTSNGEPAQLTSAKNTILYAAVGIVVAAMANAIVNFVLTNI